MKNTNEEYYVFLRACENDFRMADKSYSLVSEQDFGYPQLVYIRDAVVSYGRPFTTNRGIHTKKHKLEEEFVPSVYLNLHNEIIRLRNTLFAHSDLKERNPDLSKLGDREDEIFVIESEPVFLSDVIKKLEGMTSLIEEVSDAVKRKRKNIEQNL